MMLRHLLLLVAIVSAWAGISTAVAQSDRRDRASAREINRDRTINRLERIDDDKRKKKAVTSGNDANAGPRKVAPR